MSIYTTSPRVDEDVVEGAHWIRVDNPAAAEHFLAVVFDTFERLAEYPESSPLARFKKRRLAGIRFCVLPPPFNHWVVFYRLVEGHVEIVRVIYGTQNWRGNPASFFF